ncbi:MAG TPA: glycerol-3-phosphate 1-O-acyltransferase PlsY [Gemmatimonadaceae bacterium]|nr:glycerol-3-phosphate 1-O-acyltransferase PlsY [Gemmatimonadaceae bacterium]
MKVLFGVAISYAAGSIPWAWLAGKLLRGIDLREHGSGNLGATNVYRILGLPAAVVVLLLDAAKGAVPTLLVPGALGLESDLFAAACGLAAIVGHMWPAYFLLRGQRGGGKGIATSGGVFLVLAPLAFSVAFGVFAIALALWRYMSLASLVGALTFTVAVAWLHGGRSVLFAIAMVVAILVVWRHRGNIRRLANGTEPKLVWRARS